MKEVIVGIIGMVMTICIIVMLHDVFKVQITDFNAGFITACMYYITKEFYQKFIK